jgi:hypothetical protein
MTLYGVECERTNDITAETYVCRWEDRLKLAVGLLRDGKGTRTCERQGIQDAPGIMGRRFALVMVEGYS